MGDFAELLHDARPGEHHADSISPATAKASDMTTVAQQREHPNSIDDAQAFSSEKLQRKRSLAIKRLAEASAALDAHLKTWTPDFYDNLINSDQVSILAGALRAREDGIRLGHRSQRSRLHRRRDDG